MRPSLPPCAAPTRAAPTRAAACLVTLLLAGCTLEKPTALDGPPDSLGPVEAASAWIGDYLGGGSGQVDGESFTVEDARLRVSLDADSVKRPTCPLCVTVSLDAVFALVNVRLTDVVELNLTYDEGAVRRTLAVRRFSAGGEVGNTVTARVTIGTAGVPTPFFDVSYVLQRP
jgi:hypothetical protein